MTVGECSFMGCMKLIKGYKHISGPKPLRDQNCHSFGRTHGRTSWRSRGLQAPGRRLPLAGTHLRGGGRGIPGSRLENHVRNHSGTRRGLGSPGIIRVVLPVVAQIRVVAQGVGRDSRMAGLRMVRVWNGMRIPGPGFGARGGNRGHLDFSPSHAQLRPIQMSPPDLSHLGQSHSRTQHAQDSQPWGPHRLAAPRLARSQR